MEQRIAKYLDDRDKASLRRTLTPMASLGDSTVEVDGKIYSNFSANDYLALASHPKIRISAAESLSGARGTSASRLMTGSDALHMTLEERIAQFKGKEAALVFNSGYQANVGIISALCGKDDIIFSDRLNHASIVDGIKLSGSRFKRFRHNDAGHLEELLKKERASGKAALIVTETVFSMDGDIAPLKDIVRLKEKYNCTLMVDEAHATGIFGESGSGMAEEVGVTGKIDLIMGTFSKALGTFGAYVATSRHMKEYLINSCRSFIYSTSLPRAIIASSIKALDLVVEEPFRRIGLRKKVETFRKGLAEAGFSAKGSTQIVPIIVGDNDGAIHLSEYLRDKGYWVTPVRPPTVPNGEARVRLSLSYGHSDDLLQRFVEDIRGYRK